LIIQEVVCAGYLTLSKYHILHRRRGMGWGGGGRGC
jgi:hypothetical protein